MANGPRKKTGGPGVQKAKPRTPKGQVTSDLPLWSGAARIGGGITPQQISAFVRQADGGDGRNLLDLANECKQRDSHLQSVLATSEESIAGLGWQLTTSENARAKDKRAAKWAEEVLQGLPGLRSLIAHLAGAVFYGYAVTEIVWTKESGRLVPGRFIQVAHRRFRHRREDGKLVMSDDGATAVDLQEEFPNRFIFSRPRVNGDVPTREGLMRPLVWMSVMRNWTIADWLKTGELSWKPWRIGKYQKNASQEDREDLETIIRRMTTDFTAVIADTTEIDVQWPGGQSAVGATHGALVTALAAEMSKAVLGQTETTESSKSSGYAQAQVHDAVRRDLRESRARQVAADLTRDLVGPLIRLNFGDGVEIPRFEFQTKDEIDLKAFSEAVINLRDAGMKIPQAWAHDQTGIPMPKDGEELLGDGEDEESGDGQSTNGKPQPDQGEPSSEPASDQPSTAEPDPDEEPDAEDA